MFRGALIDVAVALVILEVAAMGALVVSPWLWALAVLAVGWPVWSERRRERRRRERRARPPVVPVQSRRDT